MDGASIRSELPAPKSDGLIMAICITRSRCVDTRTGTNGYFSYCYCRFKLPREYLESMSAPEIGARVPNSNHARDLRVIYAAKGGQKTFSNDSELARLVHSPRP